jgi:ATP-dependent Lon protease
MVFKRKLLPTGVSGFLEAAQVLPVHRRLLTNGARGQGVVTRHEMIASSQFGDEIWYSVYVSFRLDDGTETEISQGCSRSDLVAHRTDTRPGLAWAPIAGQLLPVEASVRAGSGILTFDGAMATLLEQPARVALSYVADHAAALVPELGHDWFSRHDIRIFQPYGGMPAGDAASDASSAGLAIVAALVSLLGGHLVRTDVALTGIISPSGELLPVQDLSKKAHAAQRMYTKQLVVPAANRQGGQSSSQEQHGGLELVFAATAAEALSSGLARHRLKGYLAPS